MPPQSKSGYVLSSATRRAFLQGIGATGIALLYPPAWGGRVSEAAENAAIRQRKRITLLNDGGFQGSAWGWQFTSGAKIAEAPGHARGSVGRDHRRAVQVQTESGDYALFLVLGPEQGKTYTLSGWVLTNDIVRLEEDAGAYFTASQFEFQGRPTEFTVDGKQLPEKRYGNLSGSSAWQRFSQSFRCLPDTTWFEIVVGIFRASGNAWFSDLTFVEGDQPADLDTVVDFWQAAQWAHEDILRVQGHRPLTAAIFKDDIPVRGTASDPQEIGRILSKTYRVHFVSAAELSDPSYFGRDKFDLLVLSYGESFPLAAKDTLRTFLMNGGDLLSTGGYAFRSPVIQKAGKWEFYDNEVEHESGPNLLPDPALQGTGWKPSHSSRASISTHPGPNRGMQHTFTVEIPENLWEQNEDWSFDLPASGEAQQFFFQAWLRAGDVKPAPDGYAYASVEQLDQNGEPNDVIMQTFARIRGTLDWHKFEKLFYLVPECRTLRVRIGLKDATGQVRAGGLSLERRSRQVRINTEFGIPEDSLVIHPDQIGMFDPDVRLKRATSIVPAAGQNVIGKTGILRGAFDGYVATGVLGIDDARWIPLLETMDRLGRKRGAAGALVYHSHGIYGRSSWAFFGVDNQDIFARGSKFGERTLLDVAHALARKCFLHACGTSYAAYKEGETVQVRVLATNYGRQPASLEVRWRIVPADSNEAVFEQSYPVRLSSGQTIPIETMWRPKDFTGDRYRVIATLMAGAEEIDRIESGFNMWHQETLRKGLPFEFKDNYFQVEGKSLFLQGTDDYLHTFIDQQESPLTWFEDAQGCRDACLDVYENLMGLRGPQQRPTEAWWRWVDAMLLNVQRVGGAFFPGMLVFSNTAVSNEDLADQQAYVRAFALRYKDAAGIMYYLNGDLELHDPNLPDLQKEYNRYIAQKYGSNEALRAAWRISPPEDPIGKLSIHSGSQDWADVRTLDDFQFRTQVVRRWLNSMYDSIREADRQHPVTAEFYQTPVSGIDLLTALGKLELANFGYFNAKDADFYLFPQTCKFLDQSLRGKGINVGEFGVKTHPAWRDARGYIEARTETYEHAYFLAIAHYGFALGASKIQNWCWKYPSDLPFEWGINYPNELIPRDVLFFYRNSGLLFRQLRPRYESSDCVALIAGDNRMGGQGRRVVRGQLNGLRLLLDARVRFATLPDEYLESLSPNVKTIFYPLPYCPSDSIVQRLSEFVDGGGQLYISGDISYDSLRQRTRQQRLKELCGVEFLSERFPNIQYQLGALPTESKSPGWPAYVAAPGIKTRLAGARMLLEGKDGTPVVTEFQRGRGRVIFNADPIELHGDPRFQPYAHAFYGELLKNFGIAGERLDPVDAPVHVFRVPSQDSRSIVVCVNYDDAKPVRDLKLEATGKQVRLSLNALMSGIVVGEPGAGIQAVESSGDVFEVTGAAPQQDRLLIGSDLHLMAISFSRQSIVETSKLLLLPMGEGEIRIPSASRWKRPRVLVGEIAGSRWRQDESFVPREIADELRIPISPARSLSMLILTEEAQQAEAILQMETWANTPWKLGAHA